jgi:hypothetical protein
MTQAEKSLIVHALHALAPSGGGSRQYHLACRLQSEFGIEIDWSEVGRLQTIAHQEILDSAI